MKTFITKLSLLTLVIFLASTSFSYSKKDPLRTSSGNNSAGITYIVDIDDSDAGYNCYTYIVSVKDEDGNYVDGSIIYTPGISTYVFHESGPVSGTRTAYLERIESNHSCNSIYYTQPDQIKTNFRNGRSYMFVLHPSDVPNNN